MAHTKYNRNYECEPYILNIFVNTPPMRAPNSLDTSSTIRKLNTIRGCPVTVKVNRGRNKIETLDGCVENVYPNVFTVRLTDGGLNTFTYADVMSRNILFYKRKI